MTEDILINRIQDILNLCEKYASPRFSDFLDPAEQMMIKDSGVLEGMFFGGYDGAERTLFGALPEWYDKDTSCFPIKVLKITKKYDKQLTHRHFLGTFLSLGIERDKIGDILVDNDVTYAMVSEDIADFIKSSISKIAGCGVTIDIVEPQDIKVPEKRFEMLDAVAASLRLDAVLAAAIAQSRSNIKAMIETEKVSVNHKVVSHSDYIVKVGELLSVRGYGRLELFKIGTKTRSDRVHIELKKYI